MTEYAGVALRVSGLGKSYQEGGRRHTVLSGLDLTLARGERVAVLGPSGSGKTTLLNLVAGLDEADEGTVVLDGVDLGEADETQRTLLRRHRVGFVFQAFNLIPTLTVLENLLLPLELVGRSGAEARERARSLLRSVGLEDRGAGFPDRLSGGEQQRVAVARALVHEPALILADEPTGNLDEDRAEEVIHLLEAMTRDAGAALLVVTHSRALAAGMDRALRLTHGRLEPA